MAKLRKMLGSADAPYILSLMGAIETQSKTTLVNWCVDYAEERFLPIYLKTFPEDTRPQLALKAARNWLDGTIKLPEAKKFILDTHAAAREAEAFPAAQAAARAIGQAASAIHAPTHSLGLAFYGSAAIAYDRVGTEESAQTYNNIAAEECAEMERSLKSVSIPNEPNPAKINWNC